MKNAHISNYVSWAEVTHSETAKRLGIDNTPDDAQLDCIRKISRFIFDIVRMHFGVPIGISNFFRSALLNNALKSIGASKTSQHMDGEAIDIDADILGKNKGVTNLMIFDYIRTGLNFDQLILEFPDMTGEPRWVHVSYKSAKRNRKEVLVALNPEMRTKLNVTSKYITWEYYQRSSGQ